jgi:hypothetical protein
VRSDLVPMIEAEARNRPAQRHHCPAASLRDFTLLHMDEHGVRYATLPCTVAFPSPDVSARGGAMASASRLPEQLAQSA